MTTLFLNHQQERCGVYQMGRRIGLSLSDADVATYFEAPDFSMAVAAVEAVQPRAIIYNWHPSTILWAPDLVRRCPDSKHIGLIHEISPAAPGTAAEIFRYRIVCDPSFPIDGATLFRSVRHIPRYEGERQPNEVMTVGSFGFAVGGKMFATIAHAVGAEFPGALVRLRIPHAHYGDDAGTLAKRASAASRAVTIGGVRVEVAHDFLDEKQLVAWLAGNDLNAFFYEKNAGRGIASVLDYAIAARRPIAINDSQMFRHVRERLGCYPAQSLRDALGSADVVEEIYGAWSPEQLVRDYAQMLSALGVG